MSFSRYLAPLFVLGAVVAACGDDDTSTNTGNASSTGGPSSSSGAVVIPGSTASSSSGELDGLVTLKITSDYCNKPPGQCYDALSFTVDFVNAKLTATTCVELASGPDAGVGGTEEATTTKDLAPDTIQRIKTRVAALQTSRGDVAPVDAGITYGPLKNVSLTSKVAGTVVYVAPEGACAPTGNTVQTGWNELWDTLRAL